VGIKAVVFDFGRVICYGPEKEEREEIALLAGIPPETLDRLDGQYRCEYDRGTYGGREYYKFILGMKGIFLDDESLDRIAAADSDCWKHINPGTVRLMWDIKQAGFKLGILSNMPHDFLGWARRNIPVFAGADAAVFSCELKLIKPEAKIYEISASRLGCEYKEIAFFDDLEDNIQAACSLGINGFVWKDPREARENLKRLDPGFAGL
jgi:putative hydrolase of the HAD superfamily